VGRISTPPPAAGADNEEPRAARCADLSEHDVMKSIALAAAFGALLAAAPAHATTVRRAALADLVHSSAAIVHGVVRAVDDELAKGPDGPFRTAVEIDVVEALAGLDADTKTLSLLLPGGRAFGRVMRIPGMPTLHVGDEVVLLLEATPLGYIFTGLGQGVFYVDRSFDTPRVWRDLGDVLWLGKAPADFGSVPTLDDLLAVLRTAAAGATP